MQYFTVFDSIYHYVNCRSLALLLRKQIFSFHPSLIFSCIKFHSISSIAERPKICNFTQQKKWVSRAWRKAWCNEKPRSLSCPLIFAVNVFRNCRARKWPYCLHRRGIVRCVLPYLNTEQNNIKEKLLSIKWVSFNPLVPSVLNIGRLTKILISI